MSDQPVTKAQATPAGSPPVQSIRVSVLEGPDAPRDFETHGERIVTLGSSVDNTIVLNDPTVSRYHIELSRTGRGVRVADLGSLNGTFVDAVRIERAEVLPGARLRLGGSVLELGDGARLTAPEPPAIVVPGLVGASEKMRQLGQLVERLAGSDVSALIEGETGTGKDVVARAIHELGRRRGRPFVVVDCGSLPPTLIASQLFGHERGAFTGADRRQTGAFEEADGGTLFLDEIGELPLSVQPVLLGALERRSFCRLGSQQPRSVDVRLLAATNRDLRAEVNAGSFRADLYFRIAVARLFIPPLRDRREDIESLVLHFVQEITGSEATPFGPASMTALRSHRWSGNVRELRNVVEATLAMGRLTLESTAAGPLQTAEPRGEDQPLQPYREARAQALLGFEAAYLKDLIERCKGNASEAAREAQMDRPYLLSLLKRHGLR